MLTPSYTQIRCPTCNGALRRVHRLAGDREADAAVRRYQCTAEGCAWEGLLPRRVRKGRKVTRRPFWRALRALAIPFSAIAVVAAAITPFAWQAGLFKSHVDSRWARGEHHEGEPLPNAHALMRHHTHAVLETGPAATPDAVGYQKPDTLQLRYGCVWGQPGRDPYRGGVEQALRSAALPEEVVKAIAAQVHAKQPVDRLLIRNEGIYAEASGRVFDAKNVAMTYGKTLCLSTSVNFVEGHTESAALYEAMDANGRIVSVMVPEVCGNVSVIRWGPGLNPGPGEAGDLRFMPAVLNGPASGWQESRDLPEPSTLACVLAALSGMVGLRWFRAREHSFIQSKSD